MLLLFSNIDYQYILIFYTIIQQLLDICVKNCGYPFHMQIATKEFLNELVRKFPDKPLVSQVLRRCVDFEIVH